MKRFGIDISVYQKNMNLVQAKNEGVQFVIIRGAYGNKKDTAFDTNYSKAKANGLGVGVYWWTRAVNEEQAKEEAEALIENCLKGRQFEYPIYIDVEDKKLANLGRAKVDAIISSACNTLQQHGYFAGFYMNKDWYSNKCNGSILSDKYALWMAYWTNKTQNYPMWQFGGETNKIRSNKVAGIVCDQDYCNTDYPTIIKKAGLNNWGKTPTPPVPPTSYLGPNGYFKYGDKHPHIGEIATFMRKTFPKYTSIKVLINKNNFGPNLLKAVKEFQRRTGLVPDGYIGPKTLEMLTRYGFRY